MKPSKLAASLYRSQIPRRESRTPTRMRGRCSVGDNPAEDVLVVDLTPHGCRLIGISAGVGRSEPLRLWLGSSGPVSATLKWAKKASVGVAFDSPLEADFAARESGS